MEIGINLEYVRHDDLSFQEGLRQAAEAGYRWVEPLTLDGRCLLSESGYCHVRSLHADPLLMKRDLDAAGLRASGLSAHSPLMRPDVAIPYLTRAVRFAAAVGAPVVCTSEGKRPEWMTVDEGYATIRMTLRVALQEAERYGVWIAVEPHGEFTTTLAGMERILGSVDSPRLGVNYDTGNAYLAGHEDPYEMLEALADHRVVHVHAKDIRGALLQQRGQVTGTPVGCACGEGVVDWGRVVSILQAHGYRGVLSVECGTPEQMRRSHRFLSHLLAEKGAAGPEEVRQVAGR